MHFYGMVLNQREAFANLFLSKDKMFKITVLTVICHPKTFWIVLTENINVLCIVNCVEISLQNQFYIHQNVYISDVSILHVSALQVCHHEEVHSVANVTPSISQLHSRWVQTESHIGTLIKMSLKTLEQCFSTFVRPWPGKFSFFHKTRARSQQIYS